MFFTDPYVVSVLAQLLPHMHTCSSFTKVRTHILIKICSHTHTHPQNRTNIYSLFVLRYRGLCAGRSCCWLVHVPGRHSPAPDACSPLANDGSPAGRRERHSQGEREERRKGKRETSCHKITQRQIKNERATQGHINGEKWRNVKVKERWRESRAGRRSSSWTAASECVSISSWLGCFWSNATIHTGRLCKC